MSPLQEHSSPMIKQGDEHRYLAGTVRASSPDPEAKAPSGAESRVRVRSLKLMRGERHSISFEVIARNTLGEVILLTRSCCAIIRVLLGALSIRPELDASVVE